MDDHDEDDNDEVLDAPSFAPTTWHGKGMEALLSAPRGMPVADSPELTRILNLPRRPHITSGSPTAQALVLMQMRKYSRGPRACRCAELDRQIALGNRRCLTTLKWEQAWALHEMSTVGGLLANAPVGLGKCCRADTEVFDYLTGRRRLVSEPGALNVASFDRTLHVRPATAFPSGRKECITTTLADGTSLTTSLDHPILTARGWIHAVDLKLEDKVAVAIEMPEPTNTTIATDDEIKFVAYMLSDGGCSQNMMSFTNMTPEIIVEWEAATRALGYGISERPSKSKARQFNVLIGRERNTSGAGYYTAVHDPYRERWDLFGLAKEKRAHADIWGLPRRQVALFLNRFWACDGHVSQTNLEIVLASEKLIDDLRFLLLRLGIRSRKQYKQASYIKDGKRHVFDAWRVSMCGDSALKFLDEVGDVLGKEDACQALRTKLQSTARNTNHDTVPIGPTEVGEMLDELNYVAGHRGRPGRRAGIHRSLGTTKGQYISRAKFLQFCQEHSYQGKYAHLATTDVAWEHVAKQERVGVYDVYDLNVPETHNFVANGVVIHNTLLDILAALALDVPLALLMIPASLRKQITLDYQLIAEHFYVPSFTVHMPGKQTWRSAVQRMPDGSLAPNVHVIPYTFLSGTANSQWIENLRPNAIICDEVDALADMESARTMRVMRYFDQYHATTKFCGWTGSMTDNSVKEFAHLAALALRQRSPLPVVREVIDEWSRCLDAVPNPCPPGALIRLLNPGEGNGEVRRAFRRRLAETPGVIMIEGRQVIVNANGTEVQMDIRAKEAPPIPAIVAEALAKARDFLRPDTLAADAGDDAMDEILVDPLEQARVVRQVATGMFYRWIYPRGEPRELVLQWLAARRSWHSELRYKMLRGEANLDSEKLCENAARRAWGDAQPDQHLPQWRADHWPAWRDIRDRVKPKTEAVRLHPFLVEDAAEWAQRNTGIVWYGMVEFASWLGQLTGLPVFGEGSEREIAMVTGDRSVIASIKSHGRGRNGLQFAFDNQLVVNTLASARNYQQLLGRLHRDGQKADRVSTEIYLHTPELRATLDQAFRRGEYVEGTTGEKQKLLEGWSED